MKCDEAQLMYGPYLDSELDARITLEMEQHLKSCAECARFFAEEQRFEAWVNRSLTRGVRSPLVWQQLEQAVVKAAAAGTVSSPESCVMQADGWRTRFKALVGQLQTVCRQAPRTWGAMAAAWVIILVLNLGARDSDLSPVARAEPPSVSQMRFAFKQKQWLLAQLAMPSESPRQDQVGAAGPRSQLRNGNLGNVRWL